MSKEFAEDYVMVENFDLIVLQKEFRAFKKELRKDLALIRKAQGVFQDRLDKQAIILKANLCALEEQVTILKAIFQQEKEEAHTQIFNLNQRIQRLLK
jgi:hypothetical protein